MSTKPDTEDSQIGSAAPNTVIHNDTVATVATGDSAKPAVQDDTGATKSTANVVDWTRDEMISFLQKIAEREGAETDLSQYKSEASVPRWRRDRHSRHDGMKRRKQTGHTEDTTIFTHTLTDSDRPPTYFTDQEATAWYEGYRARNELLHKPNRTKRDSSEPSTLILDYRGGKQKIGKKKGGKKRGQDKKPKSTASTFATHRTKADRGTCAGNDVSKAYTWTDCASFLDSRASSAISSVASSALDLATYASKVAGTGLLGGAATAFGAGLVYDLYTGGDGSNTAETMNKLGSLATGLMGSAATGMSGYMTGSGVSLW